MHLIKHRMGEVPSVRIDSPMLAFETTFMVKTGAQVNIIKRRALKNKKIIGSEDKLFLTGITEQTVPTLGSADIFLLDAIAAFYVVPDNFPLK